jgi:metal-responsive CopG/Arc/MetJ family transcriptional regulator
MTQLVTRIDEQLAAALDALVAEGVVESRSDGVRKALAEMVDRHRRREIGEAIVEGYLRQPQTDQELGWTDAAAIRMIEEEPW